MARGKMAAWMLAVSVAAAAAICVWPVDEGLQVKTAIVSGGQLVQTVLLRGTVQYAQQEPCISLRDGIITHVYAQEGDRVQKGQLLFRMDTTAEEKALTALYEWNDQSETGVSAMDEAFAAFALQGRLERASAEAELLSSIERSIVRASSDGVLGQSAVNVGDCVRMADVLGVVHGTEKQIVAETVPNRVRSVTCGSGAAVRTEKAVFPAVVQRMETAQDQSVLLYFELQDDEISAVLGVGELADIQVCTEISDADALIPLSAFDADGKVWYIEAGRARYMKPEIVSSDRLYAAVDDSWTGRTVILHPEQAQLTEGLLVRGKE